MSDSCKAFCVTRKNQFSKQFSYKGNESVSCTNNSDHYCICFYLRNAIYAKTTGTRSKLFEQLFLILKRYYLVHLFSIVKHNSDIVHAKLFFMKRTVTCCNQTCLYRWKNLKSQ